MAKRIRANGHAQIHARYQVTGGCDTDKNFIVAATYHAETGDLEAREFRQHRADALRAVEWFRSHQVELVVIESTANYHLLYYDVFREQGLHVTVINPIVVKSLLRVEGKSDKGDAMTLARLAASFDLKTSNMPDAQQRELRLAFKRLDVWKAQRTQATNRANSVLTGYGFTVFRLIPINSPTGLRILQAILDHRSPAEIALLHPRKAKQPEIEKCAAVELPAYLDSYLTEVLNDVQLLNQRSVAGEMALLDMIGSCQLDEQVQMMTTVPAVTRMLALRIIAEMGANFHQRYHSAEAFARAIGVVPSNEVSGGKLLKRRATHGNARVKFHLLAAAKSFAIHGHGPLKAWFDEYRRRAHYMKATSALARRIAEALWWVLSRDQPYRYWQGEVAQDTERVIQVNDHLIDTLTGEVLEPKDTFLPAIELLDC